MTIRKIVTIFIAICLVYVSDPVPAFAKEKDKTHKTHKQKRADKKKKKWEKRQHWANDYREPREKHVGQHMFKKQTAREQKKRKKHHLNPEGGTF